MVTSGSACQSRSRGDAFAGSSSSIGAVGVPPCWSTTSMPVVVATAPNVPLSTSICSAVEKFGTISNRSPRHTGAAGGPPVATSCTDPVVTSSTYRPSGDGKTARIPSGESDVE